MNDLNTNTSHYNSKQLMAYIEGKMEPDATKEAKLHLSQCSECQEVLEGIQEFGKLNDGNFEQVKEEMERIKDENWEVLEAVLGDNPQQEKKTSTLKAIQKGTAPKQRTKLKLMMWQRWGLGVSAVVVGLVVLVIWRPDIPLHEKKADEQKIAYIGPQKFKSYIENSTTTAKGSTDDAAIYYENGKYNDAIQILKLYIDKDGIKTIGDPLKLNARLLLGLSYYGAEKTDSAILQFQFIKANVNEDKRQTVGEDADWYLAICYLKAGKIEESLTLLEEIVNSEHGHAKELNAKELIKTIKEDLL